jgi:hypothetical protein
MGLAHTERLNHSLQLSITAIRVAKAQFGLLMSDCATSTSLASQIELCDILLTEIWMIRSSLEERRNLGVGAIRVRSFEPQVNRYR